MVHIEISGLVRTEPGPPQLARISSHLLVPRKIGEIVTDDPPKMIKILFPQLNLKLINQKPDSTNVI